MGLRTASSWSRGGKKEERGVRRARCGGAGGTGVRCGRRAHLVERGELLLKVGDAVGEAAEEWTLLERAEQGLQVGDLRRQILPVFDQRDLAAARVGVLRQRERGLRRPARHLADRLADGNLARRARAERLHLLGAVDERLPRGEEVAERQLREVDLLDAQLAEERRPVLLLEGLAAHVLEQRRHVAELCELRLEEVGDRARRRRARLLEPLDHEVFEDVEAAAERDPVLTAELAELGRVLFVQPARRDERRDVGLDLVDAGERRRRQREVVAVLRDPLRRHL